MSISLPVSKWVAAVLVILSMVAAFILSSPREAAATIDYGEEAAATAERYIGTPFKYGGTTPKGFDASGFTQYIYKDAATKMNIPRTSEQQYKIGKSVKESELKLGDLVFYATTSKKGKVSFVAIYRGDGKFVGATSKGVKLVNMKDKYWKQRYVGAKRVVK